MKAPEYKEAASVTIVWKWYKDTEEALLESKHNILNMMRKGKRVRREFVFKSEKEVIDQFGNNLKELRYATMLSLISAIEAAFRIDHQTRLYREMDDEISRKLLRLKQKKKEEWLKFGDDILKTWKDITLVSKKCKSALEHLMSILPFRDWLAHGRCWGKRFPQRYEPDTILMVAEKLNHNLPHNNFHGRKYLSI